MVYLINYVIRFYFCFVFNHPLIFFKHFLLVSKQKSRIKNTSFDKGVALNDKELIW